MRAHRAGMRFLLVAGLALVACGGEEFGSKANQPAAGSAGVIAGSAGSDEPTAGADGEDGGSAGAPRSRGGDGGADDAGRGGTGVSGGGSAAGAGVGGSSGGSSGSAGTDGGTGAVVTAGTGGAVGGAGPGGSAGGGAGGDGGSAGYLPSTRPLVGCGQVPTTAETNPCPNKIGDVWVFPWYCPDDPGYAEGAKPVGEYVVPWCTGLEEQDLLCLPVPVPTPAGAIYPPDNTWCCSLAMVPDPNAKIGDGDDECPEDEKPYAVWGLQPGWGQCAGDTLPPGSVCE